MKKLILNLAGLLSLAGCANPIAPTGGIKDEIPPQVDTALSSNFYETLFLKKTISIAFNEFIRLENIGQQVVVSPPLEFRPKISIKGKSVRFDFDEREILKENATYTINFGNAVVDLTEKNPAENLRFVFSTGEVIDSLFIQGKILDAYSGKPIEEALLLMHDNLSDSAIQQVKPFYFSKSNKEGLFKVENIKSDTFQLFALQDKNLNYRYEVGSEMVGFWPEPIILIPDLGDSIFTFKIFPEKPNLRINQTLFKDFGVIKYAFNQILDSKIEIIKSSGIEPNIEVFQDSLFLWYTENKEDSVSVILEIERLGLDTLSFPIPQKGEFPLSLQGPSTSFPIPLLPGNQFKINFNSPIKDILKEKIHFWKDSTEIATPEVSIDQRKVEFRLPLEEGFNFRLLLEPGSISNIFGIFNQDSIIYNIRGEQFKNYGNLDLKITGLDSSNSYIVELFPSENEPPVFRRFAKGEFEFQELFKGLNPGNYFLNIITDLNGNKKWDTGNLKLRIQPEAIMREEVKGIRANWDFELLIEL